MQGPLSLKNKMLSTPLLSKTSTPIRTRILSNQQPLNSTPINQLKLGSTPNTNKQNHNTINFNTHNFSSYNMNKEKQQNLQFRQSNCFAKTISFGDYKANKKTIMENTYIEDKKQFNEIPNLSPILALNKKIIQFGQTSNNSLCFTSNTFRSLTPNNNKRNDSNKNISKQKLHFVNNQTTSFSNVTSPLAQQQLKQSTSNSSLRSSSSFSNLFQKRSKTPTRLGSMAFGSISRKNNPSPGIIKQSLSFRTQDNKLFGQKSLLSNNHGILNQSNFDNSLLDSNKPMCFNNHGKTAKYRIKHSQQQLENDDIQSDIQNLVYCSKCAIDLVQKGLSVQQISQSQQSQLHHISLHTSPRQQSLRQSKSLKSNFLTFKTSYNSQLLQKLKTAQKLKQLLIQQMSVRQNKKQIISKKFVQQNEQIDCYYNSLISYIEQQRTKDKQTLSELKQKILKGILCQQINIQQIQQVDQRLHSYLKTIDQVIKTRNIDSSVGKYMNQVQQELNQRYHINPKKQYSEFLQNQMKRFIYFSSPIQDQFDQFVSYFDSQSKLHYKTYLQLNNQQSKPVNNALRFSFQKALQNQTRKKSMLMQNDMNILQQQSQQEYEQNSFSHQNMMTQQQYLTQTQTENCQAKQQQQKPFRTLFAQEDDILQDQDEQNCDKVKNDMYSPTFKAI